MRTRSRSNLLITDVLTSNRFFQKWYNASSGALINQYYLPASSTIIKKSDAEFMVDDNSPKSDAVKEVDHQTIIRTVLDSQSDTFIVGNDKFITEDTGSGNSAHWRVWGQYGLIDPLNVNIQWNVPDETLIRKTKDAFYNQNDIDTMLNVIEAPEFITGLKSLHRNVQAPSISTARAQKLLKLRKGVKFLSGGFLYYTFGIAPLLSDIRKLGKATLTYSKRLKQAANSAGTDVSVHGQCPGTFVDTLIDSRGVSLPVGYGAPRDGSVFHVKIQNLTSPQKVCTIRGIRSHKYLTPFFQELDYLGDRFGSVGPASFAWERIPFSFVVDWFVDASDVFNRLDNFLTGSRKMIKDACLSEKWGCVAGAVKHPYSNSDSSNQDGVQTVANELHYYHRKPISVNNITVARNSRFGKWQIAESAALLGQLAANLRFKR